MAEHEIEAKFVIASSAPLQVRERLQGLTSIGGFTIRALPARSMRDVYFDTPPRDLGRARLALRLRTVGDDTWITLKGKAAHLAGGFLDRLEIELPWSADALRHLLLELRARGVAFPAASTDASPEDPHACLAALGLHPIQDRSTERACRDLRRTGSRAASKSSAAEMSLDVVAYRAGGATVYHHEIEIEARRGSDPQQLRPFLHALLDSFGERLRPWPHDKLVSGFAIEAMMASGELRGLVDASSHLVPAAYDVLDRTIVQAM